MITVGEIREATRGMSDAAEVHLEVVPVEGYRKGWKLEMVFREGFTESPAAELFHRRHPHRAAEYDANALIPGAAPSIIDPRD